MSDVPIAVTTMLISFSSSAGAARQTNISYVPLAGESPVGGFADELIYLNGQCVNAGVAKIPAELSTKLIERLEQLRLLVAGQAPEQTIQLAGEIIRKRAQPATIRGRSRVLDVQWAYGDPAAGGAESSQISVDAPDAPLGRLYDHLVNSMAQIAWIHFRAKVGAPPPPARPRVFLSHRKKGKGVEFALAVGTYLGEKGFAPWFDEWDMVAGDSIPGKINEGIANSMAVVLVITSQYQEGKWATDEMNAAISAAIEAATPVICLMFETVALPPLLQHRVYVDFTDQDAAAFEKRMGRVIDGILRLPKNPFL